MSRKITIQTPKGKRHIGPNEPVFIVAEMSGNHNQDINRAFAIIDAAAEAGADAVKLQTYTADTLTINSDKKWFRVEVNKAWKGRTLYQLYQEAHTPWDWQPKLKKYAESKGLVLFSTPFDETSVDFLERLDVQLYKIASFENGDLELLQKIGQTKKPVIISRGMSSIEDLKLSLRTLRSAGAPEIAVLHCISSYPATPDQMNLATIPDIAKRFKVISGLSDHTLGINVAIGAVALGASIIEKHFTLKRSGGGVDAEFSLEPHELKKLVQAIRETEIAIGKPTYEIESKEAENLVFRRSLFIVKNIKAGEKLTSKNVRSIRPGYGLPPKYLKRILGKTVKKNLDRGTPLSWSLINSGSNVD
jgi:pseudaminic acid synthase